MTNYDELRARHEPEGPAGRNYCGECGEPWRCDVIRLLDENEKLWAALAEARRSLVFAMEHGNFHFHLGDIDKVLGDAS